MEGALASGSATVQLHHLVGHDHFDRQSFEELEHGEASPLACCMCVIPQECQRRARAERPMLLSGGGIFGAETPLRSSHARGIDRRAIVRGAKSGKGHKRT